MIISPLPQIIHGWLRSKFFQGMIGSPGMSELIYPGIFIFQIPKSDRLGGTGLGTGRNNLPVLNQPAFILGVIFGSPDPLDTKGALFHDPPPPHRTIWIVHFIQRLRQMIVKPVETSDFVGTVIGAITGSYTTVVNLDIQSFWIMIGSINRTDRFAGGIVTMLTEHGNKFYFIFRIEIRLNADPGYFPSTQVLLRSNQWKIILHITGRHAGITAYATL
jgi:hypothetical protein